MEYFRLGSWSASGYAGNDASLRHVSMFIKTKVILNFVFLHGPAELDSSPYSSLQTIDSGSRVECLRNRNRREREARGGLRVVADETALAQDRTDGGWIMPEGIAVLE